MVSLSQIRAAAGRVSPQIHRTWLIPSATFSIMLGCSVFLKTENLQRTGSFKIRGASNKLALLPQEQKARGVVAASAGNHAQGVALAARELGIPATIVMPQSVSPAKMEATKGYGARVILRGESYDQAQAQALNLCRQEGLTLIHAFDDDQVICGQGTVGLEIAEQLPEVEVVLVPVGGGGLIGGVALALKESNPRCVVIGVQAAAAPAAVLSYSSQQRRSVPPVATVADGIAIGQPGRRTWPLISRYVDDLLTVEEETITHAMVLLLERCKLLVEGAGAVGLAALLEGKVACLGKKVVLLLSGGNVDANLVARALEHGLATAGRYLVLQVKLEDRPGQLARLLNTVAAARGNVLEVSHYRTGFPLTVGEVEVQLILETRDATHAQEVCRQLQDAGYTQEPASTPVLRAFTAPRTPR